MPVGTHDGGSGVDTFRGTLGEDGRQIPGRFHGWLARGMSDAPFRLPRTGDPGGAPAPAATDRR